MTTPRKHYLPAFKVQVVQEVLEGNRTIGQIASEHASHPNNITKWKRAALKAMPDSFDERNDQQIKAVIERYEKEKEELYAEIGRLTTELRWLKKKGEAGFARVNSTGPAGARTERSSKKAK
jgi:transposase-like protein